MSARGTQRESMFFGGNQTKAMPGPFAKRPVSAAGPRSTGGRVRALRTRALPALIALLWLAGPAWAQNLVPNDWALKPSGLGPGDSFRLLIVTSNRRNGSDTNISAYNQWVQGQVRANGHSAIKPYASEFRAFVSTSTTDALVNAGIHHGPGNPIYWLNGPKAADTNRDFLDGSWDSNNGYDETGAVNGGGNNGHVYSGSLPTGLKHSQSGLRMGERTPILGRVGPGRQAQLTTHTIAPNNGTWYPLFALSPIFRVTPPGTVLRPVLSESRLDVEVGDRTEYTVRLNRPPSETTGLIIRRIEHDENPVPRHNPMTYEPQFLTFTPTNWDTRQTVRLNIGNPKVRGPDGTFEVQDEAQVRLDHVIFRGESGESEFLDIHITKVYRCPQDVPGNAFWNACLTIGAGPGGLLGYSGSTGSLGPNRSFTYNGTTYTVDGLYLQGGNFHISFDKTPTHPAAWDFFDQITEESAQDRTRVATWSDLGNRYDAATHTYIMPKRRAQWVDGAKVSVALVPDPRHNPQNQQVSPGPPATFEATAGDGQATLGWTAPEENADAVTGWQARHGEMNANSGVADWGAWSDVPGSSGATTTHTVTGLANGTAYGFQVRAMAGEAAGQESNTIVLTPHNLQNQQMPPGPPATFEATAGDGQATLDWTAPEENADAVTGWQARHGEMNTNSGVADWGAWSDVPGSSGATTTHTVTGLANGTAYGFQVRAMAGEAAGQESNTIVLTPLGPPTNLRASDLTHDAVTLRWDAPEGLTVSGYQVLIRYQHRDPAGRFAVLVEDTGSTATTYRVTGLEAETQHVFSVKAITSAGLTPRSEGVDLDTPAAPSEALTASFANVPSSHDGTTAFTFELRFSENVAGLSYRTLRDEAFEVEGGTVRNARRVNRSGANRNQNWEIEVEPTSNGAVTIRLPAGAVETEDGRRLEGAVSATVEGPVAEPLTASFANVPSSHDGTTAFTFELRFSESVAGLSYRTLEDSAFEIDGGAVDGARRLQQGSNQGWRVTVRPDSDAAVTIELPATSDCGAAGAICTRGDDQRPLSNSLSATVAGPEDDPVAENTAATGAPTISGTAQVDETLTASVSDISDADGLDDATFEYQWIRGSADISGATGSSYTLVDADQGERIKVRVGFTDDAGHAESLTSAATDAVAAAPEPLTATFSGVPAEHGGQGETFTFDLTFSEHFELSYKTLRDQALKATGGTVRRSKRKEQGRNQAWTIHVEPSSHGPVTVWLPAGSVETQDGRALSNSPSATVAGPVGISVADARVEEGDAAALAFVVTLSRAAGGTVRVDYATSDGSAQAGADYTASNGTLTFQAGTTSQTIDVPVLDDAHDEGEETLTLRLSNASGGRLTDDEATGTIENHDPLPRALLARFGRTAAVHVVEHVEERLTAPREPGFRGRFADRELRRGMEREMALGFLSQLGGTAGVHPDGAGTHGLLSSAPGAGAGPMGTPGPRGGLGMAAAAGPMGIVGGPLAPMSMAGGPRGGSLGGELLSMGLGHDPLTGSSFALNRETKRGGVLSFWSRGARSYFAGQEGALSLGGDVRTTMFGADYAKGPLVAGLSLGHSRGLGEYGGVSGGRVASAVTGLYPWLGYRATDRITVWGVAGYGAGGMLLTPEGAPALEAGLSMAMAAAGTLGELVEGAGGFALAFKADALWVGTSTDGVDGPAGRLAATTAAVSRFRTGLEGSRDYTLGGRLSLRPMVEVGFRQDAGDAETGAGMDIGGGVVVADTGTGLAVDVRVRMLVVHQAEGFRERGVALSFSYNPTPSTPLGFTAKVAPSWGGQAMGGAEALWGRETMAGMVHGSFAQGSRVDGEVGYGLPVGSRFVGTPRVGFSASEHGRDYRVGYGVGVLDSGSLNFEVGVDAQRRESPMLGGTDHGVLGRASVGW